MNRLSGLDKHKDTIFCETFKLKKHVKQKILKIFFLKGNTVVKVLTIIVKSQIH